MINETQAKEFALGIEDPAIPDIQKFKMATALDEYFKAEDLKIDKGVKKAFTTDTVEGVEINDDIMAGFGAAPEDIANIKKGAANTAWISRQEKKPVDYFSLTLPAYQDAYAQQVFKLPKKNVTNDEFYNLVRENYKAEDNAYNFAFSAAARDLTADSAMREFDVGLTGSPVAGRIDDYHQSIQDLHMEYTQKLAPYRTIIDQAAKTIQSLDQTPSNTFNKLTDSLVFGKEFEVEENAPDAFSKLAESLLPLPPKERLLVINAIGEVGSADPKEKKAYLEKIAIAMTREMEKGMTGAANLAESALSSVASGMYYDYIPELKDVVSGYTAKRREIQVIAGQIKMMAESKINPIEGENMLENLGLGVARMVPLMAATAISGPGAIVIMTGQFKNDVVVSAVNEGATIENAEMVAFAAAPIMAGQEYITNALPLNKIKIPFIDKWLRASTTSIKSAAIRIATRGVIGTGTEIGEEIMQSVTPLVTQDLLSDWQAEWSIESGISKADWDERMPKIADIAKETFGPALVISFLMAGKLSIGDVKNSRALMTSPNDMVASGISPELANQITIEGLKGNYNEVDKLFQKGFDKANKATPEQVKQAEARLKKKGSAALELHNKIRQEYGIGIPVNLGNGKYQFTTPILKDSKGEIIDKGVSAQFNSLSEANEAWMLYAKNRGFKLRKAEQEFITSIVAALEKNQGLDISLMDYVMPTEKFVELFPSTAAQIDERVKLTDQIEGAAEDVAFDNATLESEVKGNKNYLVYGTNAIEQREGISTGVITIYKGGGLLDVIEESAEVGVKRLMSDPMSRAKLIIQIRDVEAKMRDQAMQMGQKHMPLIATADDDKVSNMEIIEAFSHIAKSYYVQTAKAVERPTFDSDMPLNLYLGSLQSSIAGMELKDAIDLVGEKTLNILYRASQLKAIYDANGLNQDFVDALEKSVGLNVSNRNADAVVDTAAGIAADAGVSMSMGRVSPAQDAEYLDLAKDPEKNRTLLQKMVDAAAKAAGFNPEPLWHRTWSKFTEFALGGKNPETTTWRSKEGTSRTKIGESGRAIFLSYNKEKTPAFHQYKKDGERFIEGYAKMNDPLVIDDDTREFAIDVFAGGFKDFPMIVTEEARASLIEAGHDSVHLYYKGRTTQDGKPDEVILLNPSQIKSADPVTYDADGNVIPLSQRFNEASPDINFSMGRAQPFDEGQTSFSIKVQTTAANMLADAAGIPATLDKFYIDKQFLVMEADMTAAGGFFGEIAMIAAQGGPGFPLMLEYRSKNVVWASSRVGFWTGKLNTARKTGIIYKDEKGNEKFLVANYAMKDDSHTSNATIIAAKFSELERYIEEGRLSEKQERDIANFIDDGAKSAKAKSEAKMLAAKKFLVEKDAEILLKNLKIKLNQNLEEDVEEEVEEDVDDDVDTRTKKKNLLKDKKISAAFKEYKKQAASVAQFDGILKFPKVFTAAQLNKFRNELNFPQRKWIANRLSSSAAEQLGVPPMDQIRRVTLDSSAQGVAERSIFALFEIDVKRLEEGIANKTLTGEAFGVPAHGSYDVFAPGNVVVYFRTPVPYELAMPDIKAELDSLGVNNHSYYLNGRLPEGSKSQKISAEMLKQWNESQIDVMPNQAKAIVAALNDKWIEITRAGQAGTADFIRAILNNDASITLSNYIEDEPASVVLRGKDKGKEIPARTKPASEVISDLLKKGKMKIFRLPLREVKGEKDVDGVKVKTFTPEGEIYFALKRPSEGEPGDPEKDWTIVSVMNNEGGANGIMPLLLNKAIQQGGNLLDCFAVKSKKFPDGLLPTLYSRAGFQTYQESEFDESYYKGPGQMGELQKVWESQGWSGQVRPGMVWMKYEGRATKPNTTDSTAIEKLSAADANGRGVERGSIESTGAEAEGTAPAMGAAGSGQARRGLGDGAGAGGNVGDAGGVLPRGNAGGSRSAVQKVIEQLRVANDSQLAALGVSREDVIAAVNRYDEAAQGGTTFSMEKANRKNSLRVLLTKKALTNAALNQSSWKDWYSEHQDTLDEFFGDYAELFQKILSVTSQASSVKANVGLALKAFGQLMRNEEFDGKLRGEKKGGYLPAVISNLNAIKNNMAAKGRKISNYTSANEGDQSKVVVDRHIARLLFGVDTPSKSQYDKAEKLLTKIGNEIGWTPSQVQAALWAHSIVQSGKTPESYGAYLKKLESKPLTRKELKNGLIGNQLTKRIGNITRGGNGLPSVGTGRGRYSATSPTFSISRSDFTGRIEQSLRPLFEGSPEAKLRIGMMALKRAQEIAADSLYDVGRPGAAKRKLAEMEASRIKKLAKVTDKTPDWVKKSLEKETTPEQAKAALMKDKLNGWIQMHDAIVSSMPTEIRGTIGSISTLAKLSSDEARLRFIEDRIPKVEKAIEKYLKKGYGERIDKMLEAAAVKGKAGEIPKSKFIVTVQDELNTIIEMSNLSTDDTVKEAARYEAEIISAQTSEDAADALAKSQLLEIFGDLYGKQTTAEEMDVAHEYLKDLMKQGRDARKVLDEARAAEVAAMVKQAKADAFAGDANAATVQRGKDKGKGTTKGMLKGLLREHGSHRFVLSSVFGRSNKTADQFDERMILGVNAFETRQAARKKGLRDFMRSLYGTKSKISLDIELEKMETKVERTGVTKMEGEVREKDTKSVEEVERIIKSPSTFGYSAEEAQMWEDEMDAWSNLPTSRKRNLTIERIKVKGTRIEIPLSQMEAVYMAMALRQPGILDQQTVHGYDVTTQAELEYFMSDKAKNWLAWFGAEYANEYDAANEVFMRLFNTRMPQIQFYAPLLKNHQGNQAALDPLNANVVSQSANPGAVKSRRGRTSSLRIESALAVYQSHFAQMDYWINMAEYLRDTQAVMLNPEVRAAIQSEHGDEAMQAVSAWVQLEMARGVSKGALLIHSSRMMRNVKSGIALKALAFNIGTSIKTLSSIFYSLGEIKTTRWPAAFARGIQHWSRMWNTNVIQNRLELGGTPEIRHILENRGKAPNMVMRLIENALLYGSMPTQYADAVLTSYSAAMVYGDRLAQAEDAGAGEDAAHKYAAQEMTIAVKRTGQPNEWSGRSLMQNDATGVFNLLSMFSSDPQQKLSLVGEAVMKWKRGGSTNEEVVRKILAYWIIPGLMFQVANAVTRSMFKDDDEEWEVDNFIRAALVGPLQGLFVLGAAAEFFIASAVAYAAEKITGEEQDKPRNWRSSSNPLVDMSEQFIKSMEKLPEKIEDEDYLGGAWEIMKTGGSLVTPFSPAGAAPGVADRVFKDTTTLFYGKEED